MLGKEIRAGLYVVGTLLLLFCSLLFARFSSGGGGLPNPTMTWSASELDSPSEFTDSPKRNPQVRFHPTIVKSSVWDLEDLPDHGQVRTASVDTYVDGDRDSEEARSTQRGNRDAPRPIPAEFSRELANPRNIPAARPIPRP